LLIAELACPPERAIVGWVKGRAVRADMVRAHLAELPTATVTGACALAALGRGARSLLVELLVRAEVAGRGLPGPGHLPAALAAELGWPKPCEEEVRSYYERNHAQFAEPERRRVRHVLCAEREVAQEVAHLARAGTPLSDLAREQSLDRGSRASGGDLGYLGRGELVGELEDAVFGAAPGVVLGPLKSPFGWHVAVVESIAPASEAGLVLAGPAIRALLTAAGTQEQYSAWLGERARKDIVMAPGYSHPGAQASRDQPHRH